MRIIYADILITINLAVDYFVLFGTARLAGAQFLRMRALFASAIGALYSLCVIFPLEQWTLSLSRLAVSAAIGAVVILVARYVTFERDKI